MVPQPTVLHYKITTPKSKVFKFESVSKTAEVKHEMQDTKNTILYVKIPSTAVYKHWAGTSS